MCNWNCLKTHNLVLSKLKEKDIERCLLHVRCFNESIELSLGMKNETIMIAHDPKAWVMLGEPGPPTPKRNIHGSKVMLRIWCDQKGIVYNEVVKSFEGITGN